MINEETRRKLRELNISELTVALETQQRDPQTVKLSFDERFQRLVDYLYQEKYNGKIQRLIKT
ncbi:MAG: ATP-binding protein, partial [Butyrivibrio sp.]|nr:ATP-binding protein [Butyrivibrio sp.]